ncbi:MAG: lipopolysaccharide kinase InaA family protein [Candidatus Bathyarchaeota archaeon]|nr:lipopolysaccharide kinase InaA family protein [Candidatus Bathyarchaeum tardum]
MTAQLTDTQKEDILNICNDIAGSRKITAVCVYGPWACGYADQKTDINVLLVIEKFLLRLTNHFGTVDDIKISILVVNRSDFEKDIKKGWLGEFVAERVLFPYLPLVNAEYLHSNEVKTKKRTVIELLGNLILEFPESSHEFLIKNEYFMYETMMRKAKLFPPLAYVFHNITQKNAEQNIKAIMEGYMEAFKELEKENTIILSDDHIKIKTFHIQASKNWKNKIPLVVNFFRRITVSPLLRLYSESADSFIQEQRLFTTGHKNVIANKLVSQLEDPKKYILLPTPLGTISLSDKSDITDVAKKILVDDEFSKIEIKKIGGVFNDIYLLSIKNGKEKKVVVKQFLDWSNLKWLPLSMWSVGTASFSVLGTSRMEKEYAITNYLHSNGFPVPQIFHISYPKRLLFEEYVEGKELVETIREIFTSNNPPKASDLDLVKEAGRMVAKAHALGVTLGDCKPENFMVTENGIVLLDLEQAARSGNKTWDVAEFLYFSGHYSPPMSTTNSAITIARTFIDGYIEAGGDKITVKSAASPRYTKVFTVFTPPHILLAISNVCKKHEPKADS